MAEEQKNAPKNEELETPSAHEYDGIVELENPSPKWIIIIFYVTIAFALLYAIHYFGYPGSNNDQVSEYERKSAAFEEEKAEMRASSSAGLVDLSEADILANGSKLYAEKGCVACHGINGEGNNIGPNLSDNYWLNGCTEEDVIRIITEGKPTKGMTPYKGMMSEDQIRHLSLYISTSLVGSEPGNAKEAQGEECK